MGDQRSSTINEGRDVLFVWTGNGYALATASAGATSPSSFIGVVGGDDDVIDVTLNLDTSAYADGDVLSDTAELSNAVRVAGGKATLVSITVNDEDDQGGSFDIVFFRTNVSLGTKNSAPSISDTDAREYLGHISISSGDYIDLGGVQVARKIGSECALELEAGSGSTSIFVSTISRDTKTYTASGIRLKFGLLRS